MADKTPREQIDQAAAAAAAAASTPTGDTTPTPEEPGEAEQKTVLAYGATGECVTELANLLAVCGYLTRPVVDVTTVDAALLQDLAAAQAALEVTEPELTPPADCGPGVKGTVVGQASWTALYAEAERRLGI